MVVSVKNVQIITVIYVLQPQHVKHAKKVMEKLKMLMEMSTPDMIIPIHTEVPAAFDGIYNKAKVILLHDGEEFVM